MPTYLDEALVGSSKLIFLIGNPHQSLKLATEDYLRLAKPLAAHRTRSPVRAQALT